MFSSAVLAVSGSLAGCYAALALWFTVRLLGLKQVHSFPVMTLIFLILHVSYGIGFIEGAFQRLFRRGGKKTILTR